MKRLIVNVVTIIAVLSVSAPFSLTASAAIKNAVVQPSTAPAVVGALDPVAVRAVPE
jgi:hypothetical protein